MKAVSSVLVGLLLVVAIVGSSAVYIVDQREQALLFQLGEVVEVKTSPGLYFKVPFIQNVRFFDSRILTMDSEEPERFITSEKKNVLVDLFVKWRIVDVKQYYISVQGDEMLARVRLAQTINSSIRDEFGNRTVHDVVSGERDRIMEIMRQKANADAGKTNELRSTGAAEAEKIRADADRQHEVILAEAYRDAQKTMGEGDAQATAIYAEAFQKDAKFYEFYRSMDAYKKSFRNKDDILVVEPNSEFFRYLKNPADHKK